MKEEKYFCDSCKKQIEDIFPKTFQFQILKSPNENNQDSFFSEYIHLCDKCFNMAKFKQMFLKWYNEIWREIDRVYECRLDCISVPG